MQSYAALVGRAPTIVMWYQQWSEPLFYSTQLPHTQAMGALPMITWDPTLNGVGIPLSAIADGDYDSYIKTSAEAAAAWKGPIYIRLAHEMNLGGSGFGPGENGNTPAEFIAAWRHVVTIFRQEHATNVEWVWSPNVDCGGSCPFTSLYPGDAWVDWVALDGYNYSSVDNVPWETFDQVFGHSYSELTALTSKPMMIGETASAEVGGSKSAWITQTFAEIPQKYPHIKAVIWFDRDKETNWMVNSSASSLAAWQSVVSSPEYEGSSSTLLGVSPLASDVDSGGSTKTPVASPTTTSTPTTTPTSQLASAASSSSVDRVATFRRAVTARDSQIDPVVVVLKGYGYEVSFRPPSRDRATIDIYRMRTSIRPPGRSRAILVASTRQQVAGAGVVRIKLKLNRTGRRIMRTLRRQRLRLALALAIPKRPQIIVEKDITLDGRRG